MLFVDELNKVVNGALASFTILPLVVIANARLDAVDEYRAAIGDTHSPRSLYTLQEQCPRNDLVMKTRSNAQFTGTPWILHVYPWQSDATCALFRYVFLAWGVSTAGILAGDKRPPCSPRRFIVLARHRL